MTKHFKKNCYCVFDLLNECFALNSRTQNKCHFIIIVIYVLKWNCMYDVKDCVTHSEITTAH